MNSENGRQNQFWKLLEKLLAQHNEWSIDGKRKIGKSTQRKTREVLTAGFKELLGTLNYHLEDPKNFKKRHMTALMHHWEARNLKPSTLQNRVWIFNKLCGWIGKPGMVKTSAEFTLVKGASTRRTVADRNKSWEASGVDVQKLINEVKRYDVYVGTQLQLIATFGMRLRETVFFKPFKCDKGDRLEIYEGTKGRRFRGIPIVTDEQKELIAFCKKLVKTENRSIVNPRYGTTERDKEKAIFHSYNVFRKFEITAKGYGITSHGLRHAYVHAKYAEKVGVASPVSGGTEKGLNSIQVKNAKIEVSEEIGHSRTSVMGAYIGAVRTPQKMLDYLNTRLSPEKHEALIEGINTKFTVDAEEARACRNLIYHFDKPGYRNSELTIRMLSNICKTINPSALAKAVSHLITGQQPLMLKANMYIDEHERQFGLSDADLIDASKKGFFVNPKTGEPDLDYFRKISSIYSRNDDVWGVVNPVISNKPVQSNSAGLEWKIPSANTTDKEWH